MDKAKHLMTTDNKDTVFNMLIMYATNSITEGWWEECKRNNMGSISKACG